MTVNNYVNNHTAEQTFMKDFLHLEMLFHAKVLDFYTAAYKSIDDMHPEIDFAVLLSILLVSSK